MKLNELFNVILQGTVEIVKSKPNGCDIKVFKGSIEEAQERYGGHDFNVVEAFPLDTGLIKIWVK